MKGSLFFDNFLNANVWNIGLKKLSKKDIKPLVSYFFVKGPPNENFKTYLQTLQMWNFQITKCQVISNNCLCLKPESIFILANQTVLHYI